MTTESVKRKLAAIFSADVKGYSRLMGNDEEATVRTLENYRATMSSMIGDFRGRVIDAIGDNLMAEFASVVDAVQCAVEIQQVLKIKNAELPPDRRMAFRIGINLGDVIEEGERIYGDGVNIAARIESLAEAGGICISGSAYEQIENKLALGYEYLGKRTVKNIAKPIRVYRVPLDPARPSKNLGRKRHRLRPWHKWAFSGGVILLLVIATMIAWHLISPMLQPENMSPENPSIAVLPFRNLSGDPEQEYFSDGITEELINALSKIPQLFVIARNSVFAYKGKSIQVQEVGQQLGVNYVLEGSVRSSEDRMRISAQLSDTATGHAVWTERYDRKLKEMFALQDEITLKILTALRVQLTEGEQARVYDKSTDNLDSFLKVQQGNSHFFRFDEENNLKARQLYEASLAVDPENEAAYTMLAWTHLVESQWSNSPGNSVAQAERIANRALALDDSADAAHSLLAAVYVLKQEPEKAIAEAQRAVALNPNGADAHAHLGMTLDHVGKHDQAVVALEKAVQLNPMPPNWYLLSLGQAYIWTTQHEKAISTFQRALQSNPEKMHAYIGLAIAHMLAGQKRQAQKAVAQVQRIDPRFSLEDYAQGLIYRDQTVNRRMIEALRDAGLP